MSQPEKETEERVIDLIRARREAGRKKYGTTMEREDLSEVDWLQHLIEELLDGAIYAERLRDIWATDATPPPKHPVKLIAFDVFGTLLDMRGVPSWQILCYLETCVARPWRPLELPVSWNAIPLFADVEDGLEELSASCRLTTMSNAPMRLQCEALPYASLDHFELRHAYKPDPSAYLQFLNAAMPKFGLRSAMEVVMVTANPTFGRYGFGDLEMARMFGMQAKLIRTPECPDLFALSKWLQEETAG